MKKILLVASGFVIALVVFGVVGFAYAQSQTPQTPEYPFGPGMMSHGFGRGMMGGYRNMHGLGENEWMDWDGAYGPMHNTMITTMAEALGSTPEELEARHDAGETIWQIAEAVGLSVEETQNLMLSAHEMAMENAVVEGYMTEEQAEWMDGHMSQMWSGEYGDGSLSGHCGGGWFTKSR